MWALEWGSWVGRSKENKSIGEYKVQHGNTERLKNSSIIAMQKMLNHDARIGANARTIVICL